MRNMHESMTHSGERSPTSELPGWKTAASAVAGLLLAVLFILSGTWKITDPSVGRSGSRNCTFRLT